MFVSKSKDDVDEAEKTGQKSFFLKKGVLAKERAHLTFSSYFISKAATAVHFSVCSKTDFHRIIQYTFFNPRLFSVKRLTTTPKHIAMQWRFFFLERSLETLSRPLRGCKRSPTPLETGSKKTSFWRPLPSK